MHHLQFPITIHEPPYASFRCFTVLTQQPVNKHIHIITSAQYPVTRTNMYILVHNSIDNNHTHFMEQAFNKPYPSTECKCTTTKEIEYIIKSLKTKKPIWVQQDIHKYPENKLPLHKLSNKLDM